MAGPGKRPVPPRDEHAVLVPEAAVDVSRVESGGGTKEER